VVALAKLAGVEKLLGRLFGASARRKALQQRRVAVQASADRATDVLRRRLIKQKGYPDHGSSSDGR